MVNYALFATFVNAYSTSDFLGTYCLYTFVYQLVIFFFINVVVRLLFDFLWYLLVPLLFSRVCNKVVVCLIFEGVHSQLHDI